MCHKNLIFKKLKNLKAYNIEKKQGRDFNPYVYVSEHLTVMFQQQSKLLLNEYKKTRKNKKTATWKTVDSNYSLFVNGKQSQLSKNFIIQAYAFFLFQCFIVIYLLFGIFKEKEIYHQAI